jgi:hypothetical protein
MGKCVSVFGIKETKFFKRFLNRTHVGKGFAPSASKGCGFFLLKETKI